MKKMMLSVLSLAALLILTVGTSFAAPKDGCCGPDCKPGCGCHCQQQK